MELVRVCVCVVMWARAVRVCSNKADWMCKRKVDLSFFGSQSVRYLKIYIYIYKTETFLSCCHVVMSYCHAIKQWLLHPKMSHHSYAMHQYSFVRWTIEEKEERLELVMTWSIVANVWVMMIWMNGGGAGRGETGVQSWSPTTSAVITINYLSW